MNMSFQLLVLQSTLMEANLFVTRCLISYTEIQHLELEDRLKRQVVKS
jgi:hypothetical protein